MFEKHGSKAYKINAIKISVDKTENKFGQEMRTINSRNTNIN